jgi:hypothetical protein
LRDVICDATLARAIAFVVKKGHKAAAQELLIIKTLNIKIAKKKLHHTHAHKERASLRNEEEKEEE